MENRFSSNIRNGNVLSDSAIKKLFAYLGVKYRAYNILFRVIIVIILSLLGLYCIYKSIIFFAVYMTVVLTALMVYIIILYGRMEKYFNDILYYYKKRFVEYKDMKRIYTYYRGETSLKKDSVIFFGDGYYFYIFDEPLKSSGIALGRKYKSTYTPVPVLKIYDEDVIDNEPFKFKLKDIYYYELIGKEIVQSRDTIKEEIYHVFPQVKKDYVKITFDDFSYIELGANVYSYFKQILPLKEKIK